MQTAALGFVGLGHMGGNMAARLLGAGYTVYGEARHQERSGYERRDMAAVFAVIAQLAGGTVASPA